MTGLNGQRFMRALGIGVTVVYLAGFTLAFGESPGAARPNILYIFTDDQSIRSVSCYPEAHGWVNTPNIDRLAKEGVMFTHCYTGAWCMPSRVTALTGLLQHGAQSLKLKKYPMATYDPNKLPFWPSVFRKNGYRTACIGKWHIGEDIGHGRDWDYSVIWDRGAGNAGAYYYNTLVRTNGGERKPLGGYSTDRYTDLAVDYINGKKTSSKPWYLWLCYGGVHSPYTPAARHKDDYGNTSSVPVPEDIFPPRPTKPAYMKNYGVWKKDKDGKPAGLDKTVQQYNRAVRALDEGVGKVIEALKKSGQLDNTLIVFTSDQGFAWGQHGFKWKYAPYDANLRAPLIVRLPGKVAENKVCKHAVGGHDLIPTFFSMANIKLPWDMHGHDISSILKDPDAEWDHPVLMENTKYYYGKDTEREERPSWGGVPWWVSLRKGKYKYIRTLVQNEIEELYDLEADPKELVNLALQPKHRKTLVSYRHQLLDELKRTKAGMVKNLPRVRKLPEQKIEQSPASDTLKGAPEE